MESIQSAKYSSSLQAKTQLGFTLESDGLNRNKIVVKRSSVNEKNCLSNIVELTEEYDIQGKTIRGQKRPQIQKNENEKAQSQKNQNFISRFLSKILNKSVNCLSLTYRRLSNHIATASINIGQSQISQMLSKLRKKKQKKINLLPQLSTSEPSKRTLVLDLDQTIVNIYYKKPLHYDHRLEIESNGVVMTLYIMKRFGLESFLFQMSRLYEIVVFSSLQGEIVEQVMNVIDPKRYISHFLFREHCIVINKSYFIKPVRDLGRNPKQVIMVDVIYSCYPQSHPISASLNPQNLYRIDRFKGSTKDRKLVKLGYFLKYMSEEREIMPVEMYKRRWETKEILICEKENTREGRRGGCPHKKTGSQMGLIGNKVEESSAAQFSKN